MKIPGKPKEKQEYLNGINEQDFVYLVADILSFHFNHSDIKIMDGTGDGKRDIYSLNKNGEKHITQCKFHYDISKTCGSSETDELPMALNKFGYSVGCFATSSKISPQAKREYLDNYKNFELNWLDGIEIVEKVLESNLLKQIWFNGEKIAKVVNSISIPFVIRDCLSDTNIEIKEQKSNVIFAKYKIIYKILAAKQFGNYREGEGNNELNFLNGVDANVITIDKLASYQQIPHLKISILEVIRDSFNLNENNIIFVRFGYPFLNDVLGVMSGESFNLPIPCETFIVTNNSIIGEKDWIINFSEKWILPSRITASMLDEFCFINAENDISFHINYISKIGNEYNGTIRLQVDFNKIVWRKSIFLFGFNKDVKELLERTNLIPNKEYETEPNAKLLCWFHPRPEIYSSLLEKVEAELFDEGFELFKIHIRSEIGKFNVQEVSSEFAQKIAEISEPHQFNKNLVTYRTFDLYEKYEEILSPISPSDRKFIFKKIWKISLIQENQIDTIISKLIEKFGNDCVFYFDYLGQTEQIRYIIAYQKYEFKEFRYLSSKMIVDLHIQKISNIFNNIELEILKYIKFVNSYTMKYFSEELFIKYL